MQSLEEVAICDVYPYERADGEPMNPRDFTTRESAEHIAGLAAQFKANRLNPGQPVMKPILYKEGGIYWIIDGECRVRAMRAIGTERFLAEVYDDLDDAELARVEAAKAMVETDAKLGLTAEEKSCRPCWRSTFPTRKWPWPPAPTRAPWPRHAAPPAGCRTPPTT